MSKKRLRTVLKGRKIMGVSYGRSREEAERLICQSLPGQETTRMVAGNLEDPEGGAYVVAVSRLGECWYTSLLELYDPLPGAGRPRQFPGVPPTAEGVSVRFRGTYDDPVEAGSTYGFLRATLLEEATEPEDRLAGLDKLEQWIARCEQGQAFERLYANPELAEDPRYRAELDRQIETLVPDPEEREALHSFYAFRYSHDE